MRFVVLFLTLLLLAAFQSPAQQALPKPSPPADDGDVVRISTNLIRVDVTVTDGKGKPVSDLRADEIEIFENGQKQKITSLSYVAGAKATAATSTPADKNALPVPPGVLRPEQIRRTIALVVDDLSLSFESAHHTRRALKKFVDDQMLEGDLAAIIRTGAGIGALQQFTSDKRILYAALEKVRWNPQGNGGVSAFAPIESALPPPTDLPAEELPDAAVATGSGQSLDDFRSSYFTVGTLGALRYIVTGMSELPGRKSVILFSDGFKLFEASGSGFQESGTVLDFMRQLVDTANRSSVVFYTVDARGLAYTGLTAADSITAPVGGGLTDSPITDALSARNRLLSDTQEGLAYLAYETGGLALKNNNSLSDGVRRVLEDQSYYLVAYEPDSDTFDPAKRKFNKLDVKVNRPSAKVRYRSGFFNIADRENAKPAAALTPVAQLESALVSPFAVKGIDLRLNALFGNDVKNGSFVRSLLHIDAADIRFTDQADGSKKAVFDVLAMSFGDNGQVIDQLAKGYTMTLKPAAYKNILAEGFVYHFAFPVKKAGPYQYRVAIRDFQSGEVGSASQFIDVPNLAGNRLTVSSIVLEGIAADVWQKLAASADVRANPMSDTALRRVKSGSVLRYGLEIYNARLSPSKQPGIQIKTRLFRDGKLILDGTPTPLELLGQTDLGRIKAARALALGAKIPPGDYILQAVVTDAFAKPNQRIATQFVQFEVVE